MTPKNTPSTANTIDSLPTKPLLEVENLTCGYEGFQVKEITFRINQGDFLGIIGPNGSGKTSLLRAVTRILKPREGTVRLEGQNIRNLNHSQMAKKVAVVSQTPGVTHITVEDYVLLGRIPHHRRFQFLETQRDLEIAEKCMADTQSLPFRKKFIGQLSGGERQLVLIARALAQEPQLILLDEPTTFLDITHQVRIMDLIKRLNRETGLTVAMVLHDLNLAAEYCDSLLLMKEGKLHKQGPPANVLTYQTIEDVYKTLVVVGQSPVSSRPYIFVVTEEETKKRSQKS